jgi:hypothetical protein
MNQVIRDIASYVGSLIRHVSAYITGGVLAAAIFIYEHLRGQNISSHALYIGFVVFFLMGSFLTWREQRIKVLEGEDKLKKIGSELCLVYETAALNFDLQSGNIDVQFTFRNVGDHTIVYEVKEVLFALDAFKIQQPQNHPVRTFIHRATPMQYHFTVTGIPLQSVSLSKPAN